MKRLLIILFALAYANADAQYTKYIVRFTDKAGTPFSISNPSQFLSARSIARRARQNIAIDESDLPITPRYIDSIKKAGAVTVLNQSKWLNQVCIYTTDAAALVKINTFPFVLATQPVRIRVSPTDHGNKFNETIAPMQSAALNTSNYYNYGTSYAQIHMHQGEFLHNNGFRGDGMELAVIDAGFYHYLSIHAFDSIRNNGQIKETYDYVDNETSVDEDFYHGMSCLSIIAGNVPGQLVGSCPRADFFLYKSEDVNSEYPIEEQNWVAAAERADSIGVDVFTTSLGYTVFDDPAFSHTYADMNGRTTIAARGNVMAARKGIISVVAAGNEGSGSWHYLSTPADADSIITVGAVSSAGIPAGFSGYGPSIDGRIKPDVASVGVSTAIADANGNISAGNGTSFATPNMAGLVTCLWEAFPEVNNIGVIKAVQRSSTKFFNPDNRVGYGLPDMKKAFVDLLHNTFTQQGAMNSCSAKIDWTGKAAINMNYSIERMLSGETGFTQIATVIGIGFAVNNYTFSDNLSNKPTGIVTYRIRQTIGSDTSFTFDPIQINYVTGCVITENHIDVNPNPVHTQVTATVSFKEKASIALALFSSSGQRVYFYKGQQDAGVQAYKIPMQRYERGVYYLQAFVNGKKFSTSRLLRD
jgi:serine protease AprX